MEFKCSCHNSGTNSYTGKCDRCGMTNPSQGTLITNTSTPMEHYKTLHENKVMINPPIKISSNPDDVIANLDRYTPLKNGEMLEDLEGEYVLISDVYEAVSILFGAKKE